MIITLGMQRETVYLETNKLLFLALAQCLCKLCRSLLSPSANLLNTLKFGNLFIEISSGMNNLENREICTPSLNHILDSSWSEGTTIDIY